MAKKPRKTWAERRIAVKPNVRIAIDTNDIDALILALSPLQRTFAEEYVTDFNGAGAVSRINSRAQPKNYHRIAYLWLSNPGVRRYIDHLMEERTKNTRVDQGYILDKLVKALNRSEGKNEGAALKAIELFMKHLGMLTEKTEITGKDGGAIQYEKMTEDADAFTRAISSISKRSRTPSRDDPDGDRVRHDIN